MATGVVGNLTRTLAVLALVGLASGLAVEHQPSTAAAETTFTFNWTGNPSLPIAWHPKPLNDWDLLVHDSSMSNDRLFTPGVGQHGSDCSPYPAIHPVNGVDDAVFICRNHLMTMLNAGGYGVIVMTPSQIADFSGQVSIDWSVTTLRTTTRDWLEINVTPFSENLVAPADTSQDLEGEPLDTVNCATTDTPPTVWACQVINHGKVTFASGFRSPAVEELLQTNRQTPSATTRTRYQLDLSANHLRLSLPELRANLIDANVDIPFTSGVVQLSEHDYDVGKDCVPGHKPNINCVNNTWHWSDFSISNAGPFTMMRLAPDSNAALGGGRSKLRFELPFAAPPDSYFRFLGSPGERIKYSVDDKIFQAAPEQAATKTGQSNDRNFFIPIPAGTRVLSLAGEDWNGGHWVIEDPAIWSLNGISTAAQSGPGTNVNGHSTPEPAWARPADAPPAPRRSTSLGGTILTAIINAPAPIAWPVAILVATAIALLVVRRRRRPRP